MTKTEKVTRAYNRSPWLRRPVVPATLKSEAKEMPEAIKEKLAYYKRKMHTREKYLNQLGYYMDKNFHQDSVWRMYEQKIEEIHLKYKAAKKQEEEDY